jgi:hypothetical protein
MALKRTLDLRPDLIETRGGLTEEELRLLESVETEARSVPEATEGPSEGSGIRG